jgi:ornithine cyclodeaminase
MQIIDAQTVHELLDYDGLVEALRLAHLGEMPKYADRIIYQQPNPQGHPDAFIVLPAWQPGEGLLCKVVTSFPNNVARHGLANVNSLYTYIDGNTGVAEAVIDGEAMVFRKTSADSALGASLLAREDVQTMLMIGAGGLAPYLVRAHLSVRPSIRRVLVWNRSREKARKLVASLDAEQVDAEAVDDLDAAVAEAGLISSATMASTPLIRGELLRPGTHGDLFGSFTPEMREADDEVLRRSSLFVDHRQGADRSGEFTGPLQRGVISAEDIRGDLFELCQQKVPGRTSAEEITTLKNGGGSHLDYFVTRYLMSLVRPRA